MFLAMEYVQLGDLESYITPQLTEKDARAITRQLLEGLEVLHGYGWAHRDLKPQNIFVVRGAPQWWIKIGDFGISKRIREQSGMQTMVGTPTYIAPEIFPFMFTDDYDDNDEALQYTVAVDIWSLGCVLFRLLTRQAPFDSVITLGAYCRSKKKFPTNALLEHEVTKDCVALLLEMMRPYPSDRISATEALSRPWTCVQSMETAISVRSNVEKGPFQTVTDQLLDEKAPIADLTVGVNASLSFYMNESHTEVGESTSAPAIPPSVNNLHLTHQMNENSVHVSNPPNKNLATANSTIRTQSWPPFEFMRDDHEPSSGIQKGLKELRKCWQTQGEAHPDTLNCMHSLALNYSRLGRKEEAMQLLMKTVDARKRILGTEHPHTLNSMYKLAIFYSDLGRKEEAMQLMRKALDARIRILGEDHADTLNSMDSLAVNYSRLGRNEEAMQLVEKTVDARKRVLGKEHPDTLNSMYNLAISYSDLGKKEEAMQLMKKALDARIRILGKDHPQTLRSMHYLAICYSNSGRNEKAMQLMRATLHAQNLVLGKEHTATLKSMCSLATFYRLLGRSKEAMLLDREALRARKRIMGEEHPDTLKSKFYLGDPMPEDDVDDATFPS